MADGLVMTNAAGAADASLYTFLAPQPAEALRARLPFYELRRANEPAATGQGAQRTLSGRDVTFLAAEKARWEGGAELDPVDFGTLIDHLSAHLPDFTAPMS
jgi:hypothetical protein